ALQSYIAGKGWTRNESSSAGEDAEPAWDPSYSNTGNFLAAFAARSGYTYPMWDYGSLEPGYWTPSQEYQVAYGYLPDVPVPEIYGEGNAREWESLDLWAVRNKV